VTQEQTTPPTTPSDWAIEAAIERSGVYWSLEGVRHAVANRVEGNLSKTILELARMIEKHETPPLSDEEAATQSVEKYFSSTVFRHKAQDFWAGTVTYAVGVIQQLDRDGFVVTRKEINRD
jgi:hypothetical protein